MISCQVTELIRDLFPASFYRIFLVFSVQRHCFSAKASTLQSHLQSCQEVSNN